MFQTLSIFIKRVELRHDKAFVAHAMQEVLQLGEVHDIRFIHRLDDQQHHRYNAAVVTFKRWADTPSPQRLFDETRHVAAKVYYNTKRFWHITEHKPALADQNADLSKTHQLQQMTHQLQQMTQDNLRLCHDNERLYHDNTQLCHDNERLYQDNTRMRLQDNKDAAAKYAAEFVADLDEYDQLLTQQMTHDQTNIRLDDEYEQLLRLAAEDQRERDIDDANREHFHALELYNFYY